MRLAKLRESSELEPRRAKRLLRGSAPTPMVRDEHFEVGFQFLIEIAVEAPRRRNARTRAESCQNQASTG
jgi:hypothetical protein